MMPGQWKQPCIVIGAFLICGFFSSNALANDDGDYKPKEARAEIRLGYATSDLIFDDGDAFAAVALGYDKTIIGSLFIGVEGAVERSLREL